MPKTLAEIPREALMESVATAMDALAEENGGAEPTPAAAGTPGGRTAQGGHDNNFNAIKAQAHAAASAAASFPKTAKMCWFYIFFDVLAWPNMWHPKKRQIALLHRQS